MVWQILCPRYKHFIQSFNFPATENNENNGNQCGETETCGTEIIGLEEHGELQARPFLNVVFPALYLPCILSLFTVPCKMVLARPDERETCPYHFSLRLFTMVRGLRVVRLPA